MRNSRRGKTEWIGLDDLHWEEHVEPTKKRRLRTLGLGVLCATVMGVLTAGLVVPPVLIAAAVTKAGSSAVASLPSGLEEPPLPGRSVILDDAGNPFAEFYSYDRTPVAFEQMSKTVREAAVASEDARFYSHHGYDPKGIARAAASNFISGTNQGASTITQQYVKNVLTLQAELGSTDPVALEGDSDTLMRKVREVKLATSVEAMHTKDEILAKYLNIAYFGQGAYGIEAAARRYYSTSAAHLTINQAAMLVALLKNPTGYDPIKNPDRAKVRRNVVLGRMLTTGVITQPEHDKVVDMPLRLKPHKSTVGCSASTYPFYCEQVLNLLRNDPAFGKAPEDRAQLLAIGGLTIKTPLNRSQMKTVDEAAKSTVPSAHRVATAAVVVEPGTGHVTAMASSKRYGSTGPEQTQIVLETTHAFQPGSTFKPITLAAAMASGMPISTRLPGGASYTSRVFDNPKKGYYSNSAGSESNVTLTRATQLSMNTAFVQLMEKVGIEATAQMASDLGVTTTAAKGPGAPNARAGSYTLGTANVSVADMANVYATLAAGGVRCDVAWITEVRTSAGDSLDVPGGDCRRVLDEAAADSVAAILGTVISEGTGKPAAFGRPAAGKTGTTENLGAAWFAGFTPQYATAVWVGDPAAPSNSLVNVLGYSRVYGGTLPATVWKKVMTGVHRDLPVKQLPAPDPSYVGTTGGALLGDFSGMQSNEAQARIKALGLSVSVQLTAATKGQPAGVVTKQQPAAGIRIDKASRVTLTVTK